MLLPIETQKSESDQLRFYLPLARTSVIVVSLLMVLFDQEPYSSPISPYMLFLEVTVYNLIAAIYSQKKIRDKQTHILSILFGDILEATAVVGISGGYNSPFFAVFLFTMAEISLYLPWKRAGILILLINGVQVIITGVQIAAMTNIVSRSIIESRFLRLVIVGLLFVILAEILRNEERARTLAVRASRQIANLNSIFAQLGQAHMDIQRVFATVLSASGNLEEAQFSLILRKPIKSNTWIVVATSAPQRCPLEKNLAIPEQYTNRSLSVNNMDEETAKIFPCSEQVSQIILSKVPPFSESEEGLLVVGRSTGAPLGEEDSEFLQALTMQTQLALHNALLFNEREQQIAQLRAFKEIQNTFFTSAAHELKTPLTVLGLLSSTLIMTIKNPSDQQKEILATMDQNVKRLLHLTTNILATARLEAMDVVISPQSTDLKRIFQQGLDEIKTVLHEKKVDVVFNPDGSWERVLADPAKIREVVAILLSNAAKFAERGSSVEITFRVENDSAIAGVRDRGEPLNIDEKDKIFEKYYTGKKTGALAGTGLGLFIAKQILALHGGTIWVDAQGPWTTFYFSLPQASQEDTND